MVIGKLRRAYETAEARNALILRLRIEEHSGLLLGIGGQS